MNKIRPSDGDIAHRLLQRFRRARSVEDLNKAHRTAAWFRGHWHGLFQPGVQDALGNLIAPLPETETIRLLNRPQDLIHLSTAHELCLDEYFQHFSLYHHGPLLLPFLRRHGKALPSHPAHDRTGIPW